MSSKASKMTKEVVNRRINTVVQVLAIMSEEANKMSFWQRLRISNSFLWKKNINCFFQEASKNKEE